MTEQYIFTADTEPHFKRVLGEMHDEYNTHLIACGTDEIGVNIQTVKMSRLGHDMKYCEKIVGGMLVTKPNLHVVLLSDNDSKEFECIITYLVDYKPGDKNPVIDGWYMFQTAFNYPKPETALYQIWEFIGSPSNKVLNNLWRDETR